MAHIRRHPVDNTKWQVRYIDPSGRERSKTFRRKTDAEKYLVHVEARKQRAEWIDPSQSATRLGEWATKWMETRTHLKPKTRAGYESLLRVWILPAFGNMRMDRIARRQLLVIVNCNQRRADLHPQQRIRRPLHLLVCMDHTG